jgi:tetratricopeptide (TPR) repeat protein
MIVAAVIGLYHDLSLPSVQPPLAIQRTVSAADPAGSNATQAALEKAAQLLQVDSGYLSVPYRLEKHIAPVGATLPVGDLHESYRPEQHASNGSTGFYENDLTLSEPYSLMTNRSEVTSDELRDVNRLLQGVEKREPRNYEAAELRAIYYFRIGRYDKAIATLDNLPTLSSVPSATIFSNIAVFQLEAGRSQEALQSVRKAIDLNPSLPLAHDCLGSILLQMRRPVEAEHAFREAARLDPHLLPAQNGLALALKHQKRFDEALQVLTTVIKADPHYVSAIFDYGVILLERNRPAEAAPWLKRATDLAPTRSDMWVALASAYALLGSFPDAAAAYRAALRLDGSDAASYINLALCLLRMHDADGATDAFLIARTLDPQKTRVAISELPKMERHARAENADRTAAAIAEASRRLKE